MIELKPVNKKDLPKLPDEWLWVEYEDTMWGIQRPGDDVDLFLVDDVLTIDTYNGGANSGVVVGLPFCIVKALYFANGVPLPL